MNKYLEHVSCSDCILDPEFPAHETTKTKNRNPIFGQLFGILIEHNNDATFHAQKVSNCELMNFYSIEIKPVALRTNAQHSSTILDNLLIFGFTWSIQENFTNYLLEKSGILDSLTYATRKITETEQCYFTKQIPTSKLDWSSTCISDPNTDTMIN